MTAPFISVIVPVYNLEQKNIYRCLDSIRRQTYTNFEVLVINDGSTDRSGEICSSIVVDDSRFSLISQSNCGVSSARNKGLECARGEYVVFIDGDDYVDDDYLEQFVKKMPADVVIQSVTDFCWDLDGAKTQYHFSDKYYQGGAIYELFEEYNIYYFGSPWAKCFRKEIVERDNIKFSSAIRYREDELFFLEFLTACDLVRTVSYSGYHYIYYPDSASRRNYGFIHDFSVATTIYEQSNNLGRIKAFPSTFFTKISDMCTASLFSALSESYKNEDLVDKKQRLARIRTVKSYIASLVSSPDLKGKYLIFKLSGWIVDILLKINAKK